MTVRSPKVTDEQLLAFERDRGKHTTRKEADIPAALGITPARYYQLLGRLIWTEDALRIDPMLTNRLRRQSMNRQTEHQQRAGRGR
ncbi:DUF3263 domain-containing protein [Microbacterium jejuense]|uniref:DUF3263 domain-containing protein n=1 Tax=Microbacterium jejuense TaxID=1263637 RepID=A0ABS7HRT4_9MICO|nr:DUF3263 domain-containing protein [Microbacterium jejuense]MBW9095159.1 DUF3263 domain-containing protein [Microbacterium jejuense]